MVIPIAWWLAAAIVTLIIGGAITWAVIERWIEKNKIAHGAAHIVRTHMRQGKYRVVVGVFGPTGSAGATTAWEADEIHADLNRRLDEGRGSIVVYT